MLAAIVTTPDAPVAALPAAAPAERDLVLTAWNDTATTDAADRDALLPELFAARVRRQPDAPALVLGDTTWTFAEAGAAVERVAGALQRHGAGPENRVAVLGSRTPEAMIAMLAGSRPVPRICRSIRPIRPSGSGRCSPVPARPCCCTRRTYRRRRSTARSCPPTRPARSPRRGSAATTPPTSSTRPAPPARPRVWSSRTPRSRTSTAATAGTCTSRPRGWPAGTCCGSRTPGRSRSTPPGSRSCGCSAGTPCTWPARSSGTDPAALAELIDRSGIDFIEVAPAMLAALDGLGMFQPDRHTLSMIGFGG
ncbi:hypothetical protein JCM9533A_06520 [Catenuloplanes niger JCM 9533]